MAFPTSPSNNQIALVNGIEYVYNSTKGAWYRYGDATANVITSNTFQVLSSIVFSDGTSQTSAASPQDSYARTTANNASSNTIIIQGVDLTQNTNITNATTLAQSAYNNSNTKFSSSGGTITGSVTITNDLTVNGNVAFVGNVTSVTVTGNTGQFFGYSANGFNALYAGIPLGYNIEPQAVFTLSSDFDGYAAINMQNINSGANSSSDLFLIADNGSDVDGFLNLGLAGSTYNYEGYSLLGPNDGYLFVSGNTATGGGDLVLGAQLGHDVVFAVNGLNTENEVMRITSANNIVIKSGINSTSVDTGSLKVNGGIGVTGTLWASQVVSNNVNLYNLSTTIFAATNTATGIAQAAFNAANSGPVNTTSTAPPSSANNVGDIWYSTTDDVTYRYTYDGTSYYWIDISGGTIVSNTAASSIMTLNKTIGITMVFGG